jgi:hypothetical protein
VRLEGEWKVARSGGLLPPLPGVRKRFEGCRGWTLVGPVRLRFAVQGTNCDTGCPCGDSWMSWLPEAATWSKVEPGSSE